MKARWLFEAPHPPIENPRVLVHKIRESLENMPGAYPITDLLGNVQYLGGWKGVFLRDMEGFLLITLVDEPKLLSLFRDCDSRIFEGECGKLFWTKAVKKEFMKIQSLENLFHGVERPNELGGAPFEWFVANHTNWPRELLMQHGVNPDCRAPPRAPFAEKLLAYKIPAAHLKSFMENLAFFRAEISDRCFHLISVGLKLADKLPMKSILASIAREVMNEKFRPAWIDYRMRTGIPPERFSPAAHGRFRELLLIECFVGLWTGASPVCGARSLNRALLTDFETCIFEEFPEIRQDTRFLWTLDARVNELGLLEHMKRLSASNQVEVERSLLRLRGGSFQEKPFSIRCNFSGAMCALAATVED